MKLESDLFIVKPMSAWLREAVKKPAPKNLFGDFWLEGELAVLFSDAGKGKSLLATQIAQSIASGVPIDPLYMTAKAQKVLHVDFEMSSVQFAARYSADPQPGDEYLKNSYRFSKNYHRITPSVGACQLPPEFKTFEHWLLASLEDKVRSTKAKVVIIDSIVWLQGERITARHTVPLMRWFQRLRAAYGLSILIVAPNSRRNTFRPLSIHGLYGAGVMRNFADSVFAIGESRIDANFRYIKHIKSRSTELVCGESNVLVGEIRKWEKNFLSFRFHRFSDEHDHLTRELNPMVEARAAMIREMSDEGKTQRQIAKELGISLGSVNRYLQMTREDDDYFDLDDGFVLDDDEDDEREKANPPKPEPTLDEILESNLETRRQTNIALRSMGYKERPFDDIYEDIERRKRALNKPDDACGNANGSERVKSDVSSDSRPMPYDYLDDDDDDDEDPMARYGLAGLDARDRSEPGAVATGLQDHFPESNGHQGPEHNRLNELNEPNELNKLKYKTMDDKIEVGDIVRHPDGQLMKKTNWGWERL